MPCHGLPTELDDDDWSLPWSQGLQSAVENLHSPVVWTHYLDQLFYPKLTKQISGDDITFCYQS